MRELIGQKIGDYQILEESGRGAMGVVYKAQQYSLDRIVALKVLAPDLARDEAYVERFKREAVIAATLNHRNIVGVYEAGTHLDLGSGERVHYFAMEYIEGETVQRRLARQDRIPADEVAAIGVRAAQGLAYAWKKARVIHRDIKPSNIFLSSDGEVKVSDLGLARVAGDAQASLTATGAIIGTAYYMSPEQVRGESDVDFRSDIYSLGCTLYRMLCGKHLYEGAFASVIVKHLTEPPPSIRMVMPDCPMALVKVIEKMLAKEPSGRQQSYQELIEELRQAHEEIMAGGSPGADESKVAIPAPRKQVSLAVVGVAAVIAIAGILLWAPWRTTEQNVGGASAPRQSETAQSRGAEAAPTFQKPAPSPKPENTAAAPPQVAAVSTPSPAAGGTPALPAQSAPPATTAVPAALPATSSAAADVAKPAAAQPALPDNGFQPLFNGRDLTGWVPMQTTDQKKGVHQPTTGGWTVQNGELICSTGQSGWLKSERQYGDFVLQLEFKLQPNGNSGVYIRCPDSGHPSNVGMEIQILDERGVSAPGFRTRPGRLTGAIFGVTGSQQPPQRPVGEWNSMEIRCEGDNVEVTLNGTRTVSANMNQLPALRSRPRSGYIGLSNLQGEAKGMAFRNIRIKNF